MKVVYLCWYISGVFALLCFLTLLITYGPGAETFGEVLQISSASAAFIAAVAALWLGRLRRDHWIHHSRPLWTLLVAVAVTATFLLVLVG